MVVGLLEKAWPVGDAATHGTEPDVVKKLAEGECPFGLGVVDLETKIWWDPVVVFELRLYIYIKREQPNWLLASEAE